MNSEQLKTQYERFGFIRMRDAISKQQIDLLLSDIEGLRQKLNAPDDNRGPGRITNVHGEMPRALDCLMSPRIIDMLRFLIDDTPILCQGTFYRSGSEYYEHIDRYFYPTDEPSKEATVWIALEDVHIHAGPLYLVPGSHHWAQVTGEQVREKFPKWHRNYLAALQLNPLDEHVELLTEGMGYVSNILIQKIAENSGEKIPMLLKKGDLVIWNSSVAHGGFRRQQQEMTRKCLVGNYLGHNSRLWTIKHFFSLSDNEFLSENARNLKILTHAMGRYSVDGPPALERAYRRSGNSTV